MVSLYLYPQSGNVDLLGPNAHLRRIDCILYIGSAKKKKVQRQKKMASNETGTKYTHLGRPIKTSPDLDLLIRNRHGYEYFHTQRRMCPGIGDPRKTTFEKNRPCFSNVLIKTFRKHQRNILNVSSAVLSDVFQCFPLKYSKCFQNVFEKYFLSKHWKIMGKTWLMFLTEK